MYFFVIKDTDPKKLRTVFFFKRCQWSEDLILSLSLFPVFRSGRWWWWRWRGDEAKKKEEKKSPPIYISPPSTLLSPVMLPPGQVVLFSSLSFRGGVGNNWSNLSPLISRGRGGEGRSIQQTTKTSIFFFFWSHQCRCKTTGWGIGGHKLQVKYHKMCPPR